jgi:mRNA interferase MazF
MIGLIQKKMILKNIINECKGYYTINEFLDICSINPIVFKRTLDFKDNHFQIDKIIIQKIIKNADSSVNKTNLENRLYSLIEYEDKSLPIYRGQMYWIDFGKFTIGSEQGGTRPGLIIQNDIGNKFSPTVVAIAMTTNTNKANNIPVHVLINILEHETGLEKDSVVLTEQIKTVDKSRISGYIGECPFGLMKKIEDAFKMQYGISTPKVNIADFVAKFTNKLNVTDKFKIVLANEMKKYFEENNIEFESNVSEYISDLKKQYLTNMKKTAMKLSFAKNPI